MIIGKRARDVGNPFDLPPCRSSCSHRVSVRVSSNDSTRSGASTFPFLISPAFSCDCHDQSAAQSQERRACKSSPIFHAWPQSTPGAPASRFILHTAPVSLAVADILVSAVSATVLSVLGKGAGHSQFNPPKSYSSSSRTSKCPPQPFRLPARQRLGPERLVLGMRS